MIHNKPLTLLLNSNPPREIIPTLVEWWLTLRKTDRDYRYAEIFQIESVKVEDPNNLFWHYSSIFVDNKEPVQSMITFASTKIGIIEYYAEDAEGNPISNPKTGDPIQEIMHNPNILIYSCLPISTVETFERFNVIGKRVDN